MSKQFNRPSGGSWYIKVHRRLVKPPYPVLIFCPNCGHGLFKVNSNMIEVSNDIGLPYTEVLASDDWSEHKHSCKAKIVLYYK